MEIVIEVAFKEMDTYDISFNNIDVIDTTLEVKEIEI